MTDDADHLGIIEQSIGERRDRLVRDVAHLDALNELRAELLDYRDRTGEPPTIEALAAAAESRGEVARAEWRDLLRRLSTDEGDHS